jgi:hypothetical protein
LIDLESQAFEADGQRYRLIPGMQLTAEINLGTRTVLEYLLSPVRKAFHEAGREKIAGRERFTSRLRRPRILASPLNLRRALRRRAPGTFARKGVEIVFIELFEIQEHVVRALRRANELVELHLDRLGVAVLSALNQEDHQERSRQWWQC